MKFYRGIQNTTWKPTIVAPTLDNIGIMGEAGAGVGVASITPSDMSQMIGTTTPTSDNYGNYIYLPTLSIFVYIPAYYYKYGNGANGLAVNDVDIKPKSYFANTAAANASGYAIHRAFIDGGIEQRGVFVYKYMGSKVAYGSGYAVASIKNGLPLSTASAHNPIADLTACAGNNYYEAINACHAIDGIDGLVNPNSKYFDCSRQIVSSLAMLSLGHGQAATDTTNCAWFDTTYNFPKGCNNNALGDANDTTVKWDSDGYSNCGKTGSAGFGGGAGNEFAKSTHNGQNCGVADLNGLMYEINLGMTCIAAGKAITAVTNANPCNVTVVGHGLTTGDYAQIAGVVGMTELNDKIYTATVVDVDNFTLDGVDSTAFGAYTSGGTATVGTFYAAAEATEMRKFTSGNTSATDHWGATGTAAMMQPIKSALETGYPNNGFAQRFGAAAGQLLATNTTGDPWLLAGLGMPATDAGLSTAGTNLFGTDYYYQYIRNELCPLSSCNWGIGTNAGVWALDLSSGRANSVSYVGFRAACYPE